MIGVSAFQSFDPSIVLERGNPKPSRGQPGRAAGIPDAFDKGSGWCAGASRQAVAPSQEPDGTAGESVRRRGRSPCVFASSSINNFYFAKKSVYCENPEG
jgi:hypothetical protein